MSQGFRRYFSEKIMLVLSLATLATGLALLLAALSPEQASILEAFDLAVVGVFAIEYATGLWSTPDRPSFVRVPSNLLSLGIILLALSGAVFSLPFLLSAPLLRLIRAFRVFGEAGNSSVELETF